MDTWEITEAGLVAANAILDRFASSTDSIEDIASEFGLTEEEALVLIRIAEAGGSIEVGDDDD